MNAVVASPVAIGTERNCRVLLVLGNVMGFAGRWRIAHAARQLFDARQIALFGSR